MFDSSDDGNHSTSNEPPIGREEGGDGEVVLSLETTRIITHGDASHSSNIDLDIARLQMTFFPILDELDEQDICPSLRNFDLGNASSTFETPFLKEGDAHSPIKKDMLLNGHHNTAADDRTIVDHHEDEENRFSDAFDVVVDSGFGEGGEIWAKDTVLEPQTGVHTVELGTHAGGDEDDFLGEAGELNDTTGGYQMISRHSQGAGTHGDILNYFDSSLGKNWAGPEHWRIRRMKHSQKLGLNTSSKRKEREPYEINFSSPLNSIVAENIYTSTSASSVISLPRAQWRSKTRNLLPDDKHFSSRQLIQLFLKPGARYGARKVKGKGAHAINPQPTVELDVDEAFWARQDGKANKEDDPERGPVRGDYDANFFQDDGLAFPGGIPGDDDDDFMDARESFSPRYEEGYDKMSTGLDGKLLPVDHEHEGTFGSQLITKSKRARPEYVQYARVAKKVDVRRLKEEIWKGMGLNEVSKAGNQCHCY